MPYVRAAGRSLAYEWIGQGANGKPTLVFLHEGLGSIRQWRDFPAKLAAATGCRALVYDRYGYGQSVVLAEPRRTVRFMHDEALIALPSLLSELRIQNPILVGHSDGASIALIHAGAGHAVRGVVAMAPHVFIEPLCLSSIQKAKVSFETTDLPEKLARYHRDARKTFYGWADVWLDPEFKGWDIRADYLPGVRCPVPRSRATTTSTARWRNSTRSSAASQASANFSSWRTAATLRSGTKPRSFWAGLLPS
jgi:pimeloyl-ACP methyl ester carboxylesterase